MTSTRYILNKIMDNHNIGQNNQEKSLTELEDSTKKILLLKKKELRWKLLEANQRHSKSRLNEMRAEVKFSKDRMIKTNALAHSLREKYLKAAQAASMSETLHKKVEAQMLAHEKFAVEETMQVTRLALECQKLGTELYGSEYKLNPSQKPKLVGSNGDSVKCETKKWHVSLDDVSKCINGPIQSNIKISTIDIPAHTRLSSLYDLKDSFLKKLSSYRLTSQFCQANSTILEFQYTHNICPHDYVCLPDLLGDSCTDKTCQYQHKSQYLMTDIEKLADLMSYEPSIFGFTFAPNLTEEENQAKCRVQLKSYAARLITKNSDKPMEIIAQNLTAFIRRDMKDQELLVMSRKLPKLRHLICSSTGSRISPSSSSDDVTMIDGQKTIIEDGSNILDVEFQDC